MYEYEGSNSPSFDEEFTVPEHYSMEDLKHRVRSWQASPTGTDYVIEVVSERHIILSKSKHDLRICCVGCAAEIIGTFLVIMVIMGTITYPYDYNDLMNVAFGAIGVVGVIMAIFIGLFCLRPQKSVIEMRFGHEIPIKIQVRRSGEIEKSQYEYASLKSELQGGSQRGGPSPTF